MGWFTKSEAEKEADRRLAKEAEAEKNAAFEREVQAEMDKKRSPEKKYIPSKSVDSNEQEHESGFSAGFIDYDGNLT